LKNLKGDVFVMIIQKTAVKCDFCGKNRELNNDYFKNGWGKLNVWEDCEPNPGLIRQLVDTKDICPDCINQLPRKTEEVHHYHFNAIDSKTCDKWMKEHLKDYLHSGGIINFNK
jgi:uncharacterized protein YlaI